MTESKTCWHHCNNCLRETKHIVLYEREKQDVFFEQGHEIEWRTLTSVLECGGCESVALRKSVYCTEDESEVVSIFPPAVSRQKPRWHDSLPEEYQSLLIEVYAALHADSRMLVLMGARALIDVFMTRNIGDIGSFQKKLAGLVTEGFLSVRDSEMIDSAVDAGSAAAHRGHFPTSNSAASVLDIVENLLHKEVLLNAAMRLRETTPPRAGKP
jgi:hypothetical protein